jgi:hypothetical protein
VRPAGRYSLKNDRAGVWPWGAGSLLSGKLGSGHSGNQQLVTSALGAPFFIVLLWRGRLT